MKKNILIGLFVLFSASVFGNDFINRFMEECIEKERPVNNVNIGKAMMNKMAANSDDEELKKTFKELNSIRIITTENEKDSKYYFKKATELIDKDFKDYNEVVSVNDRKSKINIFLRGADKESKDLILIALDEDNKLTVIAISGNIDFNSISKLTDSLRKEDKKDKEEDELTNN